MNRAILRVFLVCAVLFAVLIVNLSYLQVAAAPGLKKRPENHLQLAQQLKIHRGAIRAFDGSILAASRLRSGYYRRYYPHGPLAAHVVGYDSVRFGRSGVEASMNEYLTGQASGLGVRTWVDRLLGRRSRGADVTLTLVPGVQTVAEQQLAGKRGAIVALDPATGAVIASASAPSYSQATLERRWAALSRSSSAPLLDRANQALYPPGSSFKVLTAAAGLDAHVVTPTSRFVDTGVYTVSGGKVVNYGGEVFGAHDFTAALTHSINTTFAKVGVRLGRERLIGAMQNAGFWSSPPLELPAGQVRVSGRYQGGRRLAPSAPMDDLAVAWAACGQERVLATPLQMALVAASVANGGYLMKPYLVEKITAPDGRVVRTAEQTQWLQVMSPQTAGQLNAMMQDVVRAGTGTAAALAGISVAGKTGTAETGRPGVNQAWFIAFAPAEAPKVAVAVSIENTTGTGGEVAAPMAAAVLRAALAAGALP